MRRAREINIKICLYYFFDDIISMENPDPNNINIDDKSYNNILTYYMRYVTCNKAKPLHFITNEADGKKKITEISI